MRKWILIVLALAMSLGSASRSLAGDVAANGLFYGAGSGALIGQAIGRNTDATLLGAAIGGVLGYIVGNEQEKAYARGPGYYYQYPGPVYTERRVVVRQPTVIYRAAPQVAYYPAPVPFFNLNLGWIFHDGHRDYRWTGNHRNWRGNGHGWAPPHRTWRGGNHWRGGPRHR